MNFVQFIRSQLFIVLLNSIFMFPQGTYASSSHTTIRVAAVFDLTGTREATLDIIDGIKGALNLVNDIDVNVVFFDSGDSADGTKKAMQQAIEFNPDIIIAEHQSAKAEIAAEIAERHNKVMITTSATALEITADRKYVFRLGFTDEFQGRQLAKYSFNNLEHRRAVILRDANDIYSQSLHGFWSKEFEQQGGEIHSIIQIDDNSVSFKGIIEKIIQSKVDVVVLPVYEKLAIRFINAATLFGLKNIDYLGGDGWNPERLKKSLILSDKSPNLYWASHSKTNKNNWVALGHDSMVTVFELFQNLTPGESQDSLANRLRNLPRYQGQTGTIFFNKNQSPSKSIHLFNQNGNKTQHIEELSP